jgi:photosystem II stability/assembly factor-like uncharacterized protein
MRIPRSATNAGGPAKGRHRLKAMGWLLTCALLLSPLVMAEGLSGPAAEKAPPAPVLEPASEQVSAVSTMPRLVEMEETLVTLGNSWQTQGPAYSIYGQTEHVLGPNPVCGAVHALAPHPTNPDVVYAGAVNGGVWRTTNATAGNPGWTPLTDRFPSLCIADVKFDPTDPTHRTLVAGTGRFSNFGRRGTSPTGIMRTTDGGYGWAQLGEAELTGMDIWAVAPRGNTILVATGSGLFRSTDKGSSFQNISGASGLAGGPVFDLATDPSNDQRIYASVGGASGGVFRTGDSGATWTDVTDAAIGALLSNLTVNMEMAVSAASGNAVFLGVVNDGRLAGMFRSTDHGANWTAMDLPGTAEGPLAVPFGIHPGGQGLTNFSIAADPTDGNIVYVGGDAQVKNVGPDGAQGGGDDSWPNSIGAENYTGRLFRGNAGVAPTGGIPSPQWTPLTHVGTASNSAPHADSRDMAFTASGVLLESDDGGVYKRTDPRTAAGDWHAAFTGGLQVGEFHDIAYDDNFNNVFAGSQDTGCPYQPSSGALAWIERTTADGGDVAIFDIAPGVSLHYWSNQFLGGFKRMLRTGANTYGPAVDIGLNTVSGTALKTTNPGRNTQFVTPIAINAQDPTRIAIGCTNSVYESFDNGDNVAELVSPGVNRNALLYGHPSNPDFIVVGSGPQVFVRTTAVGPVAVTAADPPVADDITDVTVDPADANLIIAVDPTTVCVTWDGGSSWADVTGNLSYLTQGNIQTVAYIPGTTNDVLAVGAAGGVFACVEPFGGCWFELGKGIPNAVVFDLDYDPGDDRLAAGTLGRGAWTLDGIADIGAPVTLTYPNGGETLTAGCQVEVTWIVGEGYEDEILNILFSGDGGDTWTTLLTNTPNDGNDVVTLPCEATTEGRIKIEVSNKTFCDTSNDDFETVFPSIDIVADVDNSFSPPDPWVQEGLVIDTFEISSDLDLFNVRFEADPLQDPSVPCEGSHVKAIHGDVIEFVPEMIDYLEAGETAVIEIKTAVPVGQHAGTYEGKVRVSAEHECDGCPAITDDFDVTLEVTAQTDVDVADNGGNVSDNVFHFIGAKNDLLEGTFTVVNPNSAVLNVDPDDGPGNIRIDPDGVTVTDLVKVGDPGVAIPSGNVTIETLVSLASGEAQMVSLSVLVPDGIPVNAVYKGTVEVTYESCLGGDQVTDDFTVQVEVRKTQGPLDIVQTELVESFCPDDPWIDVGQVEFEFDIHAEGDHRNVRVSSGGLEHETLDKKLDDFNFFPEEFALISAGQTKTARVIVKIPIGQRSGTYSGYIKVVSEDGGEDSVMTSIEICPLYDLDIKDYYASLSGNVMVIPAFSRANASGGEWALQAFDVGLPSGLVNNHDEFDGPSNTPVDSIVCEFAEWSTAWHEGDHAPDLHTNFVFTGTASVDGDFEDWEPGEFRRLLVGVFVPPMKKAENSPGIYRGRLDCWAMAGGEQVAHDYFDIEIHLARVEGPGEPLSLSSTFGAVPTVNGAKLFWGDFTKLGMTGGVNLYRQAADGAFNRVEAGLPQKGSFVDTEIDPKSVYTYRLGVESDGVEVLLGPVTVGGLPRVVGLFQNYPNPFRDVTVIPFDMPKNGHVSIRIYDAAGRLVRTLKDGEEIAGFRTISFDGRNQAGQRLPNGVYYCHLIALNQSASRKIVIVH